jgi:hypothetical protein
MTRRMYRYEVPVDDQRHHFDLTFGPVAVRAADDRTVEFWAEHQDDERAYRRAFQVFGTGHDLPDEAGWVGTCQRLPSGLVWHLFEVAT